MTGPAAAGLRGVSVVFKTPTSTVTALDGVDADFPPASSTAVMGRSGSGKSTMISVLSLTRRPTAGEVFIQGRPTAGASARDRLWFFGLARALGARGVHIAALVMAEVAVILILGTALALAILAAAQPAVEDFAWSSLEVHPELLDPAVLAALAPGILAVLVIAAGYPTLKAVRHDPLDVLEAPRGQGAPWPALTARAWRPRGAG
ncbi:MAG: ATP-binding cassette domain-containing protein [Bifidobacteriaceae bacterium]|nr:ATP-binding cassette domain-containing protein [Bifidobacteriaceae bacterium]